eukprot:NODE_151_length_17042_cov_0.275925.p9 type:complete len:135 gc:universal NODE_151_length_17042_cov_0.275925:857-1261(+)
MIADKKDEKNHLASEKRRRNQIRTGFRHLVLLVPALRQHLEESGQISQQEVNEAFLEAMFEKHASIQDEKDIIGGHQISKSTILGASAEFIEIIERKTYEYTKQNGQLETQLMSLPNDHVQSLSDLFEKTVSEI